MDNLLLTTLRRRITTLERELRDAENAKGLAYEYLRSLLDLESRRKELRIKDGRFNENLLDFIGHELVQLREKAARHQGAGSDAEKGMNNGYRGGDGDLGHGESASFREESSNEGTMQTIVNLADIGPSRGEGGSGVSDGQAANGFGDHHSLVVDQASASSPVVAYPSLNAGYGDVPSVIHQHRFQNSRIAGTTPVRPMTAAEQSEFLTGTKTTPVPVDLPHLFNGDAPESSNQAIDQFNQEQGKLNNGDMPALGFSPEELALISPEGSAAFGVRDEVGGSKGKGKEKDLRVNVPNFVEYGIMYRPINPTEEVYSTVIISNIEANSHIRDVLAKVRGGGIVKIALVRDPVCKDGTQSAMVTFLSGTAAQAYLKFMREHCVVLDTKVLKATRAYSPTHPQRLVINLPNMQTTRPLQESDSRCLKVSNYKPDILSDEKFQKFITMHSHTKPIVSLLSYLQRDAVLEMHFTSIQAAQFAREQIGRSSRLRGCVVRALADPCGGAVEEVLLPIVELPRQWV